jgi:tRNA (guanine-N7-)-methyltransferase
MGGRKDKLKRIAAINTFSNVYQNENFKNPVLIDSSGNELHLKGNWNIDVFKNDWPIVLELACGKGEYTIDLATRFPNRNYIGIDFRGPRIFTGAKMALEKNMNNVAFTRMKIENILNFFAPEEVSEIWITFPDPFPKDRHEKHRLTHKNFLKLYKQILKKDGLVNLKTDDIDLFRYSAEVLKSEGIIPVYYREDIYAQPLDFDFLEVKTYFEKKFMAVGRTINFLQFKF